MCKYSVLVKIRESLLCVTTDCIKVTSKLILPSVSTQQTFVGLQDVLKTSSRHVLKTSSTRLQRNNFTSSKTSWRHFQDLSQDVLKASFCKTSWRRLENVLKTSWRRIAKTNILVLTKTSSEDVRLRRTYSSWSRHLEDVFIKTNVCWVDSNFAHIIRVE